MLLDEFVRSFEMILEVKESICENEFSENF